MNAPASEGRAAELRQAFDRSFALPPAQASREVEDLLIVRVKGDPYAIRLREIVGVVAKRTIVSVPASAPGLCGLVGLRGDIVPVFGLSSILGYGDDADSPPWMVLCGAEDPIALGFSELEGYVRLPKSSLHADENLRAACQYVNEIAATDAGARPVIGLPLVVASIRNRLGRPRPKKEQ